MVSLLKRIPPGRFDLIKGTEILTLLRGPGFPLNSASTPCKINCLQNAVLFHSAWNGIQRQNSAPGLVENAWTLLLPCSDGLPD